MSNVIRQIVKGSGDSQTIKIVVKDAVPGPAGRDGAIQYTAGTGISIVDNVISATGGGGGGAWGEITGDIDDQTDLQQEFSLYAKTTDIPTVNNATLTIQQNGTNVATFTANASTNTTANISAPVITMTDTDPGEGSALAANNFIAVYGEAPLNLDYSTAEADTGGKWVNGDTIYKKTIDFGALPNATSKTVAHNISNLKRVVKIEGYGYNPTIQTMYPIPFSSHSSASYDIGATADGTNIEVATGIDRTSLTECYITLYYTKNS